MLHERDLGLLDDVRRHTRRAIRHCSSANLAQFLASELMSSAVMYELLVIGEAARGLSADARVELPQLDWRRMTGLRNILAHQYTRIDLNVIWDIVQNELPELLRTLTALLDDYDRPT